MSYSNTLLAEKQEVIELKKLFLQWTGSSPTKITQLSKSGSARTYFRLSTPDKSAIGVFHKNDKENKAFVNFSKHFLAQGLAVPTIYAENLAQQVYLQEDLGDTTLYQYLFQQKTGEGFPTSVIPWYKKAVKQLAHFQIKGHQGIDYRVATPRASFDKPSILWDLNYFKYYFLKLAYIPFDEQLLENDFEVLTNYLCEAPEQHFLYRDFQARNIMVKDDELYFIDYQGGRKGALQYDLVSLLFQSKADLPTNLREELVDIYIAEVNKLLTIDEVIFRKYYHAYALIRCLQVFGAYGFRGFYERKSHFLQSIPYALKNLQSLLPKLPADLVIPELRKALEKLVVAENLQQFTAKDASNLPLVVTINSFSYKRGLPTDDSGNGGGFIFDCRAIHNPGRYAPYKKLTGRDQPVIDFLKQNSHIEQFLASIYQLVDNSVTTYLNRNFSSLTVSFGCTGGQHRSVYSADSLANYLQQKYNLKVRLNHIEQELKGWVN